MIELKNVSKFYSNNGVVTLGLRNINLKLNKGEIVAITGDSGSGKSTLLNVITAVDTYEEGEILFEGNETSYFNQNDMDMFRKNHISFIFQNYNIIDSYTVLENVMLPLLLAGKKHEEAKKEAKEIIEKVGLGKRIHHRGTKLSGGEKQRCVIARALASDSKILACDEPTGNLDSQTGDEIIKLIQEVAKDKLVLIVTHNYNQVKDIITRRIKMSDGEVIEDVYLKETDNVEPEEELALTEKKVPKGTYLRLALQNVISTPKKTIFSTIVFMVISFITFILCLMTLESSYETYHDQNRSYSLKTEDRMIVYEQNHKPLDKSILEKTNHKEIYYNAFYEEIGVTISVEVGQYIQDPVVSLTYNKFEYSLVAGTEPQKNGEYIYVMPKQWNYYNILFCEEGRDFGIETYDDYEGKYKYEAIGKIVGFATSKCIDEAYLLCYETFDQRLMDASSKQIRSKPYYQLEGSDPHSLYIGYDSLETYISCPKKYEGKISFRTLLSEIYDIPLNVEIRYEDEAGSFPTLYCRGDFYEPNLDEIEEVFEAVIYTDHIDEVRAELERAGYKVSVPCSMKVKASTLNLITLYLWMILVVVSLLCSFFISYVILSRVYASKNKDYGVLRTLGMVKKQLGRIVILEVISIGLLSALLSFIIFIILYHTTDAFSMGSYMNFSIVLFYFVVMLIFSYFIARRFNRRLYKFSVNTTVKGEVARND